MPSVLCTLYTQTTTTTTTVYRTVLCTRRYTAATFSTRRICRLSASSSIPVPLLAQSSQTALFPSFVLLPQPSAFFYSFRFAVSVPRSPPTSLRLKQQQVLYKYVYTMPSPRRLPAPIFRDADTQSQSRIYLKYNNTPTICSNLFHRERDTQTEQYGFIRSKREIQPPIGALVVPAFGSDRGPDTFTVTLACPIYTATLSCQLY